MCVVRRRENGVESRDNNCAMIVSMRGSPPAHVHVRVGACVCCACVCACVLRAYMCLWSCPHLARRPASAQVGAGHLLLLALREPQEPWAWRYWRGPSSARLAHQLAAGSDSIEASLSLAGSARRPSPYRTREGCAWSRIASFGDKYDEGALARKPPMLPLSTRGMLLSGSRLFPGRPHVSRV